MEAIPAFLRAVTILKPHGNLVAEVAAEVARLSAPWWRRMLEPRRLVPTVIVALLLAGSAWLGLPSYLERRQQNAEAAALVDRSRPQVEAGNYAKAWELLEQANAVAPASREVFEAQEQLAMKLLRGAGLSQSSGDRDSDKALANWARPVLARGSSGASGERLANLLAHMGWADYLRGGFAGSDGFDTVEPDPVKQYRSALEADPANVYAHAMWGFELLRAAPPRRSPRPGDTSPPRSKPGGSASTCDIWRSPRCCRRPPLWIENPERPREVIRVVNAMRIGKETRPKGWERGSFKSKVWSIYYFGFVDEDKRAPLLAALPPADHLATFHWLFPADDPDGDPAVLVLQLRVLFSPSCGSTAAIARARWFRTSRLLGTARSQGYNSSRAIEMVEQANVAIRRLGG